MKLKIGDPVPKFKGVVENGETISDEDLMGEKFILYFYPADDTPTCTKQACNLRDSYEELKDAKIRVFGVSPDSMKSHIKFINKYNLPFSLIADEDRQICNAFGVWGEKTNFGRTYMGVMRTTFLINESGHIEQIIQQVKAADHTNQILQAAE